MVKQFAAKRRTCGLLVACTFIAALVAFLRPAHMNGRMSDASISFQDNFTSGNLSAWQMPYREDWEILAENGLHYLHMIRSRPPAVPRRPIQFARLKNVRVGSFDLEAKVRRDGGSMMVVFNYVDSLHFYYVHLSKDRGTSTFPHNGLFIVNGAPRRRIAGAGAAPALPDRNWHTVRIVRNVRSGSIKVYMDGETRLRFSVVNHAFTCGQIGLGSFDETGDFTDIRLRSHDAGCHPAAKIAGSKPHAPLALRSRL
ncbi:MAG: hypothetical protein ACRD2B_16605 [Terriglobia bacterium]